MKVSKKGSRSICKALKTTSMNVERHSMNHNFDFRFHFDFSPTSRFSSSHHGGEGRVTFAPRSSSIKGISRAKIKTVKLTVVVILGYIVCSAPFICVQLWATFGSPSEAVSKFRLIKMRPFQSQ